MNYLGTTLGALSAATALAAGLVSSADAQQAPRRAPMMEIYPPHIAAALDQQRTAVLPGSLGNAIDLQGVFNRTKLWQPGQTLRVCFFDGPSVDTLSRIARAAKQWEKAAVRIKLDLGNLDSPRLCRPGQFNEVRVGYAYKGYWSVIGQDALNVVQQTDQTMNLEFYNSNPPTEPEFSSTVLHEFGHAIGLQHEHQNPKSTCEQEFEWDKIYQSLSEPPNGWDKAKVDFNMRRLLNDGQIKVVGDFDKRSIMLYTFPAWMYKDGVNSSCFFAPNTELSDGDRATVASMSPADIASVAARKADDLRLLQDRLSAATLTGAVRDRAQRNLDLMSAGSVQNRASAIQLLNATTSP